MEVYSVVASLKQVPAKSRSPVWRRDSGRVNNLPSSLQASLDLTESRLQWETATQERLTVSRATERTQLQTDLEEVQMAKLRADRSVNVGQKEISKTAGGT